MTVLDDLVREIAKDVGEDTVVLGSVLKDQVIERIETGSVALDVALGGGWPLNQWIEIVGDESQGKTAIVLKTIATNQASDPNWTVLWIAAEAFVPSYAVMMGVDMDRVIVVDTNIMEHAYNAAVKALESRAVDCVVIDSLPALVPTREDEDAVETFHVGLSARVTNSFFRKAGAAKKRSMTEEDRPVAAFVINQWRQKIGVQYGDNRTTPGGLQKNFECFVRCEIRRDDWIEDARKVRCGQTTKVRIFKNKSAPGQRVATFDYYFDSYVDTDGEVLFEAGEFDRMKEIANLAIALEVVEKKGSMYHYGGRKWRGRETMVNAILDDPEMQDAIVGEVMGRVA